MRFRSCYCHVCKKSFDPLGIARHRAMHKGKKEDCKITFTHGDTYEYNYAEKQVKK